MTDTPRLKVDRPWSLYPIGTKAHAVTGGHWTRTERGWKALGGDTFPTPGGDACGDCIELPEGARLHPFWIGQTFYRFDDDRFGYRADGSVWCHELESYIGVTLTTGRAVKLTPKGAHVEFSWREERWIGDTVKAYAYPDIDRAWKSYQIRKRRQVQHLERQLARARIARDLPRPGTNPTTPPVESPRSPELEAALNKFADFLRQPFSP